MAANAGALPHPRSSNSRTRPLDHGYGLSDPRRSPAGHGQDVGASRRILSRTVFASPLGRPPGLPVWPGLKPLPVMPPGRVVSWLFSAMLMCSSIARGAVDTELREPVKGEHARATRRTAARPVAAESRDPSAWQGQRASGQLPHRAAKLHSCAVAPLPRLTGMTATTVGPSREPSPGVCLSPLDAPRVGIRR